MRNTCDEFNPYAAGIYMVSCEFQTKLGTLENMYVQYDIGPVLFKICSGNEVRVKTSK